MQRFKSFKLLSSRLLLIGLPIFAANSFAQSYTLTPDMAQFSSESQAYPLKIPTTITQVQPDEQLTLKLPEKTIYFKVINVQQHLNGTTSIIVQLESELEPQLTATKTFGDNVKKTSVITFKDSQTIIGRLQLADKAYKLRTNAQGVWLQQLGQQNRQAVKVDAGGVAIPNRPAGEESVRPARQMIVNGTPIIDVMVLWDPALQIRLGTEAAVETLIQQRISMTNQAFADSEVEAEVRLVHTQKLDASDYDSNATTLENLQANDGDFRGVETLRTQHGADLVGYLRDFNQYSGSAGIAYRLGADGEMTPTDKDYAYFVVTDGDYDVGRTNYYSPENTFSHELGHNLGAEHDHSHAGNETPIFSYAYGHDRPGEFATIMSYESNDGVTEPVMRFSNPDILCTPFQACGVEEGDFYAADNARTFNQTAYMVAAFNPSVYAYEQGEFRSFLDGISGERLVQYLQSNQIIYSFNTMVNQENIRLDDPSGLAFIELDSGIDLRISSAGSMSDNQNSIYPKMGWSFPIDYQVSQQRVSITIDLGDERLEF